MLLDNLELRKLTSDNLELVFLKCLPQKSFEAFCIS